MRFDPGDWRIWADSEENVAATHDGPDCCGLTEFFINNRVSLENVYLTLGRHVCPTPKETKDECDQTT